MPDKTKYIDVDKLISALKKRAERYYADGEIVPLEDVFISVAEVIAMTEKHAREDEPIFQDMLRGPVSWETIRKAAENGDFKELLPSGTILPLVLINGDNVGLIVGYDSQGRAYLVFRMAMRHFMTMSHDLDTSQGYAATDMAGYADKQMETMIPETIITLADEVTMHETLPDDCTAISRHKVFCLSYTQVFGRDGTPYEQDDSQIDIFRTEEGRKRYRAGINDNEATAWWLRTPATKDKFWAVGTKGKPISMEPWTVLSPVFAIRVKGTGNHHTKTENNKTVEGGIENLGMG